MRLFIEFIVNVFRNLFVFFIGVNLAIFIHIILSFFGLDLGKYHIFLLVISIFVSFYVAPKIFSVGRKSTNLSGKEVEDPSLKQVIKNTIFDKVMLVGGLLFLAMLSFVLSMLLSWGFPFLGFKDGFGFVLLWCIIYPIFVLVFLYLRFVSKQKDIVREGGTEIVAEIKEKGFNE